MLPYRKSHIDVIFSEASQLRKKGGWTLNKLLCTYVLCTYVLEFKETFLSRTVYYIAKKNANRKFILDLIWSLSSWSYGTAQCKSFAWVQNYQVLKLLWQNCLHQLQSLSRLHGFWVVPFTIILCITKLCVGHLQQHWAAKGRDSNQK